ncbi:MAG TPA: hypothetical protein VJL37_03100 [Flavobacterium sp.]|nr:hypothetical protein [Flavobacterium sp.]
MSLLKNKLKNIVFAVLLLICQYAVSQNSSRQYYKKALELVSKSNLDEAGLQLDKALAKDSLDRNVLILKANLLFTKEDCWSSYKCLYKAIELDGKFIDTTVIYFSDVAECLKDKAASLKVLEDFLNKNESDMVTFKLAQKYVSFSMEDKAVELLKKRLEKMPHDVDTYGDLAKLQFYSFKKEEEALGTLRTGLLKNPNNPKLLFFIAGLYYELKDFNKAIDFMNQVVKLEYNADNIASRAIMYEQSGNKKEAYNDYNRVVTLKKCGIDNVYFNKLQYEFDNKMFEALVETSLKVLQCDPKHENKILDGLYLGFFYCGDFKKGNNYLDKRLSANPDVFIAYYIKALLLFKDKKYTDVLKYLDLAMKTSDITANDIQNVMHLKLLYYLIIEDYNGFIAFVKPNGITSTSVKDHPGFEFTNMSSGKPEVVVTFNKKTGVINAGMSIPFKTIAMLESEYGFKW